MPPGQANAPSNSSGGIFVVLALGVIGVVWVGAQLAALLNGERLAAGLAPTFHALVRLPANAQDPRLAWGPPWQNALPAAPLYWACTAFAAALGAVAVADLYAVDGEEVTPSCEACRAFVERVVALGSGRPDEMGQPWSDLVGVGGWNVFTDGSHKNHVHVGWRAFT